MALTNQQEKDIHRWTRESVILNRELKPLVERNRLTLRTFWRGKPLKLPSTEIIVPLQDDTDGPTSALTPGKYHYNFDVTFGVVFDGLRPGEDATLKVVLTEGNTTKIARAFDWVEIHGTEGLSSGQVNVKEVARIGQRVRLAVCARREGVTMHSVKTGISYWRV